MVPTEDHGSLKICVTCADDAFLAHVPPKKLAHLMETFTFSRDEDFG